MYCVVLHCKCSVGLVALFAVDARLTESTDLTTIFLLFLTNIQLQKATYTTTDHSTNCVGLLGFNIRSTCKFICTIQYLCSYAKSNLSYLSLSFKSVSVQSICIIKHHVVV